MTAAGGEDWEDRLAARLAEIDDALAAGGEPSDVPSTAAEPVDAALGADLDCLRLLERVWPRSGPPATFGRFRIVRELGRGGFGVVFLALDPELGRHLALKLPRPEALVTPELRRRFVREARAAAALDHPNLVPLYEAGRMGEVCYIASAYCEGPTLAAWLRQRPDPVPVRPAARLVAALADAVEHAHGRGVLHRDLKPSNILLQPSAGPRAGPDGLGFVPRITDFGLAKLMEGGGEETASLAAVIGSAPYMAPEQAEPRAGAIGPPTDVYALGAILYAVLCGRPPHRGSTDLDTLRRVVSDEPVAPRRLRRDLPRDLENIVLRCLEKDPARRYRTARDLADDLHRFLAGEPTRARPLAVGTWAWRWARRHPTATAAALVGLLALGLAVFGYRQAERHRQAHELVLRHAAELARRDRAAHRQSYAAEIREAARVVRNGNAKQALALLDRTRPAPGGEDLRGFEWSYLRRLCHGERAILRHDQGEVYHAAFAPDGATLATAGQDRTVRLWDVATGRPRAVLRGHDGEVNWVAYAPGGTLLATASDDRTVRLWEASGGSEVARLPGHGREAVAVLFTPDGRSLLSGDRDGRVRRWDLATRRQVADWPSGVGQVEGMAVSSTSPLLAVCGWSGIVAVFDWTTGRSRPALADDVPHRPGTVQSVAFASDGRTAATTAEEYLVKLWDAATGRPVGRLRGHHDGVYTVAFAPDGRALASAGAEGSVRLWDVDTRTGRDVLAGHTDRIWDVAFAPDGRRLASASRDGTVRLWDTAQRSDRTLLTGPPGDCMALAFSGDSTALTLMSQEGALTTWDVATGSIRAAPDPRRTETVVCSALAPDATAWATNDRRHTLAIHALGGTWPPVRLPGHHQAVGLVFSPDGSRLAAADRASGSIEVFEMASGRQLARFPLEPAESDSSLQFALSRQGDKLAVLRWDRLIVYDLGSGRRRRVATGAIERVKPCLAYSPDGSLLAVASSDRTITLRDATTLEPRIILPSRGDQVGAPAFSPDGRRLAGAASDQTVRLWDTATGQELVALEGHTGPVQRLAFAPDGRTLASCAATGRGLEAILWRASGLNEP